MNYYSNYIIKTGASIECQETRQYRTCEICGKNQDERIADGIKAPYADLTKQDTDVKQSPFSPK